MKKKSRPIRTCLGCGKKGDKYELLRICFCDGKFVLDDKMVLPGRGCYLCRSLDCLEKLKKNKRIFYALRVEKTASLQEIYMYLTENLKNRSI